MGPNLVLTIQEVDNQNNLQLVKFAGEFDKAGHAEIRAQLDKCAQDFSAKNLIFDFSGLKFINSEGIGYLMEIHTHLVSRGRQLIILGSNSHVKDVFKAIGIAEIIPIYEDLNDFLKKQ